MVNTLMLKGRIAGAGYTQRSLAQAIPCNKDTLNQKVNGNRPFNTDEIERICILLHITNVEEKCQIFLPSLSHF